jgi:hypothetical protein
MPQDRWRTVVQTERAARKARIESAIEAAKTELDNAEKRLKKATGGKQELEEKKAVADAKQRLNRATDLLIGADTWEPRISLTDLRVGDFGKLSAGDGFIPTFRVFQVLDAGNALLMYDSEIYWAEMDTSGLVDGRSITLTGIVECTRTRPYTTAIGGTKTVFVLKYHGE